MSQPVWKQKVDLFRRRFGAREDIFGVKYYADRTEIDETTNLPSTRTESWIMPQCENFGNQSLCLITQRKGRCVTCTNKKYSTLTDEWIWKHVSGEKELILYLLQDGGIKFGACDFDRGDPFEDALFVRNYSVNVLKLPCYISRSSKKGYHVYWFFEELAPAHLFTSMVRHIFSQVGIYARSQANSEIPIPEVFPKQTMFDSAKQGNGIKIPMIEPKMKEGFNCWVDLEAKPYPVEAQWEVLKNCEEISVKRLEDAIAANNITVLMQPMNRSKQQRKPITGPDGKVIEADASNHKPRKRGDFLQVVHHCPALRKFWEKDPDGTYKFEKTANENGVPHTGRLASMLLALSTTNGKEEILKRWNTDRTKGYLEHAEQHGYTPVTCRWMQDNNLCRVGVDPIHKDHCFKKQPPKEIVSGHEIENPNGLPESEWPEPSPIRLATIREKLSLEQIESQLTALFALEPAPADLDEQFQDLVRSAKRLPKEQYDHILDLIKREKWVKSRELKKVEKTAENEIKAEQLAIRREAAGREFSFKGSRFFVENGRYMRSYEDAKGVPHTDELTNFTVDIHEEIFEFERMDSKDSEKERYRKSVFFIGSVNVVGEQPRPLRVAGEEWQRGTESFFAELIKIAGGSLLYMRSDCDYIRQCVNHFSKDTKKIRKKIAEIGNMKVNKQDCYMMPSVMVTKESILPNDVFEISFKDDACAPLDFRITSDEEFKDLARHVLNDYFNCNVSIAAMTSFAHAMSAAILPFIPMTKSPVLFIYGNMGSGKSFVAEVAQCFFGDFKTFTNTKSSGKGQLELISQFRDAMLLIDDFKMALSDFNGKDIMNLIQQVYDRSTRFALKRNGELRDNAPRARGLLLMTGQDIPEKEDSALSRMLIVHVPSRNIDPERGTRVKLRRKEYGGFTPHFIQYVYNAGREHVKTLFDEYVKLFKTPPKGKVVEMDGVQRISENLAMNMTAFHLAMEMLHTKGVIDRNQQEDLCAQHRRNLHVVRTEVYNFVNSQKGVTVFLDTIRDLLQDPARAHIINWPGAEHIPLEHKGSHPLGFYKKEDPDVVYLFSGASYSQAKQELKKRDGILHPQTTIGKQLESEGHLKEGSPDESEVTRTKYLVGPQKTRVRCWVIKLSSLGVEPPKPVLSGNENPLTALSS